MVLKRRTVRKLKKFNIPVSYKLLDDKLADSKNIFDNKDVTETRYGIASWNDTSLAGNILSTSFYKTPAGVRYVLAKVGDTIYTVPATGAATAIKTGLTATTKHRAVTINGRHIIACESDGLFSFNGTTFTALGQAAPSAPTVAASGAGLTLPAGTYQVSYSFYSSALGFESNVGAASGNLAVTLGQQIDVSAIAATASNPLMDKVRVYVQNITTGGQKLFYIEINLSVTTTTITSPLISTRIGKTSNAAPISGGGKYLCTFGKKLAYTGNSTYLNDVYVSQEYLPDAFSSADDAVILKVEGQGATTGIAQGLFNNSYLEPYLLIFTKTTTTLYSEIGGIPKQSLVDEKVGCISHDTIIVRNGLVYWMAENSWYVCDNGRIAQVDNGNLNDAFSRTGWVYELNRQNYPNFFSAYYPTLDHYMTFVSEGASNTFNRAYNLEFSLGGFRPFEFKTIFNCACSGEDGDGDQCVFLGDPTGKIFIYSNQNERHDVDPSGTSQTIEAFMLLPFVIDLDNISSYNFRFLTVKAIASSNPIIVKIFSNYNYSDIAEYSMDFPDPISGFVLDVSMLDVGTFSDGRTVKTATVDITRTAETIMIGFYQDILDANIALISAQLDFNKNGKYVIN